MKTKRATGTGFLKAGRYLIIGIMMPVGMTTATADRVAPPLYRVKSISFDQLVISLKEAYTNSGFILDREDNNNIPVTTHNGENRVVRTVKIRFIYNNETGKSTIGVVDWLLEESFVTEGKCDPCVLQISTNAVIGDYREGKYPRGKEFSDEFDKFEPLFSDASNKAMITIKTILEDGETTP